MKSFSLHTSHTYQQPKRYNGQKSFKKLRFKGDKAVQEEIRLGLLDP